MSLKLRFALLFTIVVATILLLSSIAIYYFSTEHRRTEHVGKLRHKAEVFYDDFVAGKITDTIKSNTNGNDAEPLFEQRIVIFNNNKQIIFSRPDSANIRVSAKTFTSIKSQKEFYYRIGGREFIGLYKEYEDRYIVASAIDRDGLSKSVKLRFILLGVFLVSCFIATALSYFFVTGALKPLSDLSNQIKSTTEKNLSQQVNIGKGKDEIVQIAASYNAMLQRLQNAFELQKNFVHYASHELRTPLTVMHATTETALNKNLSVDEYKQVLASLQEDQNNLIELTNSLLFLSQFEKQQSQQFQRLRLDEVVYDAIGYCKKIFPGITIDFEFENIPEEEDLFILGNDTLLKAAFTNLIKNAFLYSPDKKLTIGLYATQEQIQINFSNKGNQLSQSEIENMKIPFSNAENIGLVKGIGLGLSIVEKIINLHKGSFVYAPVDNDINKFSIKWLRQA